MLALEGRDLNLMSQTFMLLIVNLFGYYRSGVKAVPKNFRSKHNEQLLAFFLLLKTKTHSFPWPRLK